MELILNILYFYIAAYSIYFMALAIRNLNDKSFKTEQRYSQYEEKENLAVIIYSHNNKATLENLIQEIKSQDYPVESFKVFAILDNCIDGSEDIFKTESFVNVINIKDVGTVGKDQAISILLERLCHDSGIGAYVFIDGDRSIAPDFLSSVSTALARNSVISGETLIVTEVFGPVDKIKAAYQKYHMNFIRKARSLFGLAAAADSGVFIIKKEIVDTISTVDFKDINSELKYSLLLSKIKFPCSYNPNIQTFVEPVGYEFRKPRLSARLNLFRNCLTQIWSKNFAFAEHTFSLLYPNFWLLVILYLVIMKHSYNYYFVVDFKIVLFSFVVLLAAFGLSLINAKLTVKEVQLLLLYPLYSIGHILKNFPPVRTLRRKIRKRDESPDAEKLSIDVVVMAHGKELPCKLEFISDSGLAAVRFIFKNKKFTTAKHLRMVDALQELRTKLHEYSFILKICYCCQHFTSSIDGSTNMLKGICHNDYPSHSIKESKPTLIWNFCDKFCPSKMQSFLDGMVDSAN